MTSASPLHSTPDAPLHPAPETHTVATRRISCDGGEGALGHPRIWLTIPEVGWIDCPYCDARYVLAEGAEADGH